jgi:hypothetical protein
MSSLPFMGESVMCSLHAITPMKMIGDEDDDLYQIDVMELTAGNVGSSSLHREYLQVGQLMGEYWYAIFESWYGWYLTQFNKP